MRLAVIPARGGSKRIPRKNIKMFAGRPMISYAISAAQNSGAFDFIAVSSDDDEILTLSQSFGAMSLARPRNLADDFTPTVPVITHAISELENRIGRATHVCCIYATVPFLTGTDLSAALDLLGTDASSYVFPVIAFPSAIQRALKLSDGNRVSAFFSEESNKRSQDLVPAYYDAGQFYWGSREVWLNGKGIHANGIGMPIPEWRAVDIDTPDDWTRAERLFAAQGSVSP